MKKIRLSDTDVELFDIEIAPTEYNFYVRHKDAFKTMWREQVITEISLITSKVLIFEQPKYCCFDQIGVLVKKWLPKGCS